MPRTFSFIKDADIFDPFAVRSLPRLLSDAGFEAIRVDDAILTVSGGEPMAVMFEMSWQRFDTALKTHGVITEEEIAVRHAAHHDPTLLVHLQRICRLRAVAAHHRAPPARCRSRTERHDLQ